MSKNPEYTKLTLRVRKRVVLGAKRLAASKGTSVSKLVEGYLENETDRELGPPSQPPLNPGAAFGIPVSDKLLRYHDRFAQPAVFGETGGETHPGRAYARAYAERKGMRP